MTKDFESELAAHLHAELDNAPVPPTLSTQGDRVAPAEVSGRFSWRPIGVVAAMATIAIGGALALQIGQQSPAGDIRGAVDSSVTKYPETRHATSSISSVSTVSESPIDTTSGRVVSSDSVPDLVPSEINMAPNYAGAWQANGHIYVGLVKPTAEQEAVVHDLGFRTQIVGRTFDDLHNLMHIVDRELDGAGIGWYDVVVDLPDNNVTVMGEPSNRIEIERVISSTDGTVFKPTPRPDDEISRMGPETLSVEVSKMGPESMATQ